jgi:hypothetical protein
MVTCLRLKIAVEKSIESDASLTKRSTSACSNYIKIDPNTISYDATPKPWDRSPAVTFVSDTVTQGKRLFIAIHSELHIQLERELESNDRADKNNRKGLELTYLAPQWTIPQLTKILISTSLDKIPS